MKVSTPISSDMQACIDACTACHAICLSTAMNHCLKVGGKHVEQNHFRLMLNCSALCQTCADFMLSGSPQHAQVCAACAAVCEACAEDCAKLGGMDACIQACRSCAETCRQMAA